jgi:hypothetical protein
MLQLKGPQGVAKVLLDKDLNKTYPLGFSISSFYIDSDNVLCCSTISNTWGQLNQAIHGKFLFKAVSLCERSMCTLKAVINSKILSLHPADFQCEICFWCTATEPVWDPRITAGNQVDQALWRLAWLLQVPIQIGFSITIQEALTGLAGDGGQLSRGDRQGE